MTKNLLVLVTLALMIAPCAFAQTVNTTNYGGTVVQPVDVLSVTSWQPFLSLDSTKTYYSSTFSIAPYDSIACWVSDTSYNGTPKFTATLQTTFDKTYWETGSSRTMVDTTTAKLEGRLTFYGKIATQGATYARIAVAGSSAAGPYNRTDDLINLYLVCHKRGSHPGL